jgi:N-acetylmuramoyl-L-alanine amidase
LPPTPTTIPAEPAKDASAPSADSAVPAFSRGAAVVAAGGADIYRDLDSEPYVRAHEGLLFPVVGRDGEWLELLDHCDDPGWVHFDEVAFTPAQTTALTPGMAFSDAVIVVDPGHGGPNIGAVGPTGLIEKEVNLDIARRTRDLLNAPHTVDWETGEILDGSAIPPAGQVWLTRPEGPEGADIEAGLTFRTTIADSINAHALISIHNNAAPDGPYDGPGSEVYHQVASTESKRLSGLIVEEMRRGFSLFEADWVGDDDAGAKIRVGENGVDIYGILRLSDVPAVIAEGVYISNPSEEALLATPEFRQAYADAVYRALIRFITTEDGGSGFVEVEPFTAGGLSSGAPVQACTVAAQPNE